MTNKIPNLAELQIVEVPIDSLHLPDYYNRVEIEGKKPFFKKSIEQEGLIYPLLINSQPNRENFIIDGVARFEVCKELGYESIKVMIVDVPKETEKLWHILANQQARKSMVDFIKDNLTGEILELYLEYLALSDVKLNNKKVDLVKSSKDGFSTFHIAVQNEYAEQLRLLKKEHKLNNLSEVIIHLIKNQKK